MSYELRASAFRTPSNFHNKRKYNRPPSDGKEKILPQGGLYFGANFIYPVGDVGCNFLDNFQYYTLRICEQMTGFSFEHKAAGDYFRSIDDNAGFFIKRHGHGNQSLFRKDASLSEHAASDIADAFAIDEYTAGEHTAVDPSTGSIKLYNLAVFSQQNPILGYSPWIGIKYAGFVRLIISLSSSLKA
jgi:hypothetical protein